MATKKTFKVDVRKAVTGVRAGDFLKKDGRLFIVAALREESVCIEDVVERAIFEGDRPLYVGARRTNNRSRYNLIDLETGKREFEQSQSLIALLDNLNTHGGFEKVESVVIIER